MLPSHATPLPPPGKTTLLRHLLENSKEKIACIVNDVASINIDAKLVRNDRWGAPARDPRP
jgi:Ni2+-binding GTPase involved in maturation of urease and hydrogenase